MYSFFNVLTLLQTHTHTQKVPSQLSGDSKCKTLNLGGTISSVGSLF